MDWHTVHGDAHGNCFFYIPCSFEMFPLWGEQNLSNVRLPEKPESSPGASAALAPRERAQPCASSPASRARQPDSPSAGRKSLGVTCRRRMKHPKRPLPPPHVALTHIGSSLECEIKACAPSGGFGPRPLPSQVNTVCEMRWLQKESKPRPRKSAGDTLPETFLTNLAVCSRPTYIDIQGHGAGGFCALCCISASRGASPGSRAQRVSFHQEAGLGGTSAAACRSGLEAAAPGNHLGCTRSRKRHQWSTARILD